MSEKDDYYGHVSSKPALSLDELHQADRIPLQPTSVISNESAPQPQTVIETPPIPEIIAETHLIIDETLKNRTEELTEEILELIYIGDYRQAYSLSNKMGIDVASHPRLFKILENEIREISLGEKKPIEKYFKLFYLLGGNIDLDAVPGLKDFIRLVFDHYCERCWPNSGPRPLIRLINLFGKQIDFGYTIEELKMDSDDSW